MTHPYRLALSSASSPTCLDPPIRVCEPTEPSRSRRMKILVFACAFITGAVGAVTFRAVGHGGHVEIGPAALTHARIHDARATRAKRESRPRETPPPPPAKIAPAAQMPLLSGVHDSKSLLKRARDLQSLGVDVSVSDVELPRAFTEWPDARSDFWPAATTPLYGSGHQLDALELRQIPADSALRAAGLAEGDQLLGIDGYTLADNSIHAFDFNVIRHRGSMVVELARGEHHVVLSIRWPVR